MVINQFKSNASECSSTIQSNPNQLPSINYMQHTEVLAALKLAGAKAEAVPMKRRAENFIIGFECVIKMGMVVEPFLMC